MEIGLIHSRSTLANTGAGRCAGKSPRSIAGNCREEKQSLTFPMFARLISIFTSLRLTVMCLKYGLKVGIEILLQLVKQPGASKCPQCSADAGKIGMRS